MGSKAEAKAAGSNLKILIIDDDKAILRSLSFILRTQHYRSVFTLDDATEYMEKIEKYRPSVVLLDLNMPIVAGETILKTITNKYTDIITIILTAENAPQKRQDCMELGAFAYLVKPVSVTVLLDALESTNKRNISTHTKSF